MFHLFSVSYATQGHGDSMLSKAALVSIFPASTNLSKVSLSPFLMQSTGQIHIQLFGWKHGAVHRVQVALGVSLI